MQNHILYSFRRCPYAIRARMAISYSNIKVELREISLKEQAEKKCMKYQPKELSQF